MTPNFKTPIIRDEKHRRFVASLPCVVTGVSGQCQAAHIRKGGRCGMGLKPDDSRVVPLHYIEHARQHRVGDEESYWKPFGGIEKAIQLASDLYENTGNREVCLGLIRNFKISRFLY